MATGTFQINGRRFRVIPEEEYKTLQAAKRAREQEAKQDARDLAIARRRLKNPKRKTIPLSRTAGDAAC